ncbi:MAG: nitronate monooxygenase [Dehalococcoidales bacterium]|nr:MAG: nitronate monooxygenase [Dehalococcoidales bacterium]
MFRTRITELFGIEYPIIQGALGGGLSRAGLVSAVSNAGGLGMITSLNYATAEGLREEIRETKSLTDKPFAVNVTLLPTMRPVNYEEYFAAALDEGVRIIETSGRSPEPYMKIVKDAGAIIMHKVGGARHAKSAERVGVDAVSVVSFEAAGHPLPDDVASSVLIPACVDAVKIPVIAAGGIADGRGFVSALSLGAEGVLMGTRFTISKECSLHEKAKEWLLQLGEADTMLIHKAINNTERVVKTEFAQKILEMEEKGTPVEEILPLISGENVRNAYSTGDISDALFTVGQVVGLVHDIPTVQEIMDGIISEASAIIQHLQGQ